MTESKRKDCSIREALKITAEKLAESEEKYRGLVETAQELIWKCDQNGRFSYLNPAWEKTHGYKLHEMLGKSFGEFQHPEIFRRDVIEFTKHMAGGFIKEYETNHIAKDGRSLTLLFSAVPIFGQDGVITGTQGTAIDITDRKRAERQRLLTIEILGILNKPEKFLTLIDEILAAIKKATGFEAVGIRLKNGEDFPYYSQSGFSEAFLATENTLLARNAAGDICRGKNKKACLECICGLVIAGKGDQRILPLTAGGSIWTNDLSTLLDIPSSVDPRLNPRNRCIHDGYYSVAVIPIKSNMEIVGTLQFNDRRKGCFTTDLIQFFEGLTASIGVALIRKQQDNALHHQALRNEMLLDSASDGIHVLDSKGNVLQANAVFCRMLGYTHEEILKMNVKQWDAQWSSEELNRIILDLRTTSKVFETKHRRRDGQIIDVEVSAVGVEIDQEWILYNSARDISVRKDADLTRQGYLNAVIEAQEAEGHRIAKDLHDGVIQILGAALHRLRAPANSGFSHTAEELLTSAITETRRITQSLRPIILDDLGLVAAIQSFCSDFEVRTHKKIELRFAENSELLSKNVELALFRIVAEALTNIERHSNATKVRLDLRFESPGVCLKISDNGKGFTPGKRPKPGSGLGLLHIKERANGVGGAALIESLPGKGTSILVNIPVAL